MAIKSQATSLAAIPVHWPRCRCGYAAEQMEPCGDCGHCAYCPQCGGCNYCLFDAWLEDREPKEVSQGEEAITRIVRYWEKLIAACMKAGKRIADIPEPSHRRDEAAYLLEGRKGRIPRPFPK